MENIAHQNCVKFLGHVVTEDGLYHYIITELCECNLYKYLKDVGGTFDQFHMILTAKKLAIGYKYLYERKIIHRDIKLEVKFILIVLMIFEFSDFRKFLEYFSRCWFSVKICRLWMRTFHGTNVSQYTGWYSTVQGTRSQSLGNCSL